MISMFRRNEDGFMKKMAFSICRKKSGGKTLSRAEPVSDKSGDRNSLRGHAIFVRFLERRGLSDCVHYFPEEMTLGLLRTISPRELVRLYNVEHAKDRERIMRVIEESCREDQSEEVSRNICLSSFPPQNVPEIHRSYVEESPEQRRIFMMNSILDSFHKVLCKVKPVT